MEFDIERSLKNFGDNILVFGNDLAVKVSYRNFDMKRGRNCVKYSKEFQAGSTDSRRYLFLIGALFMPPPPPPLRGRNKRQGDSTVLCWRIFILSWSQTTACFFICAFYSWLLLKFIIFQSLGNSIGNSLIRQFEVVN